jgi:hypothetical protein
MAELVALAGERVQGRRVEIGSAGDPALTDLDAFFTDHWLWAELDAGVDGPIVWIVCECGARIARRVDDEDPAGRIELRTPRRSPPC